MSNYVNIFIIVISVILIDSTIFLGQNLTGIWQDNNGTRYSFRQVDNELYWRMEGRPEAYNVFYGVITSKIITGEWVDLPGGQRMGNGTLAMEIITDDLIRKTAQNGNYGASEWIRIPDFTQPIGGTKSSMSSDWKEIYSFGGPKVSSGELLPPPETSMVDRVLSDKVYDEKPQFKLTINEIKLKPNNDFSGKCFWPGDIVITVKNIGQKTGEGNDLIGINGKITMLGISEEKGAYERVNVDLKFGRRTSWGSLKYGMKPGESRTISASYTGIEGYTVGRLGHFFVRVELTKPIWDENTQKERYLVVQSSLKEFNLSGFDLSIPAGSLYMFKEQNNSVSLGLQVENNGEKATPGDVVVEVIVPIIDRKNVLDNWVEFRYNFGKSFTPGKIDYIMPGDFQSFSHPEKGEPDWANTLVNIYSTCQNESQDLPAFDKNKSNNYFYLKSRQRIVVPKP